MNSLQISDKKTREALDAKLSQLQKNQHIQEARKEANRLGIVFVSLSGKIIPTTAVDLIPEKTARKHRVIVFHKDRTGIKIAVINKDDPQVLEIIENLKHTFNLPVEIQLTTDDDLEKALETYKFVHKIAAEGIVKLDPKIIESLTEEITDYREITTRANTASISEFLNLIFAAALKINASDIHFQPEESAITLRLRIDGVLHHILDLAPAHFSQIKKRIKLLARLKINIENQPQEGSFSIKVKNEQIDMRVSAIPSNFGETITIRVLNPGRIALEFEALGLNEMARAIIEREIKKPNGMIITTGPTGSGKTTTLYTILKKLNQEGTQIITLEDPIEYKLPGIVQMQVTARMGFAQGLKAILRQDPDIIMVGEIRELETADTAVNAALTGHLVLSTVHTNNAAGAIPRFSALGVKSFLLAPSLNLIIGQRLVRRVCPKCSIPFELNAAVLEKARTELKKLPLEYQKTINFDQLTFYQGHSCAYCNGLGYKGRIGIYELLPIDDALAALIQEGKATESAINAYALSKGMITMAQDGLLKALNGLTTVEEVLRVTE